MHLGNFLICNGTVKVSDFGLGKVITDANQSHTGTIGALIFRAPEAYSNMYDKRCDIWSYGIVVWQLWKVGRDFLDLGSSEISLSEDVATWFEKDCATELLNNAIDIVGKIKLREIAQLRNFALQINKPFQEVTEACLKLNKKERPKFYELVGKLMCIKDNTV